MRRTTLLLAIVISTAAPGFPGAASAEAPPVKSPATPVQEREAFHLADPNLVVELVASEPNVVSPVAMAWDAAGRLYVAEMIGYPLTPNLGRIRRLEDRDGDGRYERSDVFADKLSFPAGLMPYKGGILVAAAPDVIYMEDVDGDGKADVKRVEWTGFVPGVQQLRANALHWGLDNWIYGANGRSDYSARRPDAPESSAIPGRARDFRFNPRDGRFEAIVGMSQFGLCHDDWGNRFLSWNTVPLRHAVIEEPYLADLAGPAPYSVVDTADPADSGRVFPVSPPPRIFNTEQTLYYNATCGLTIYRGDALGPEYEGNALFCEALMNLVTRRKLQPDGPTFCAVRPEGERNRDFLASADGWTHFVFVTTGPDGCMYIVDFYREFVEHPQYIADAKARETTNFRRGEEHGRIWRVRRRDFIPPADRRPRLGRADGAELVQALNHPVGWWRDTAQRLMVERRDQSVVPQLKALVESAESPQTRLHALWTLDGLGALDDGLIVAALQDDDSRIRRSALNLAEGRLVKSKSVRRAALARSDDRDPAVKFQLALVLKSLDTPAATDALAFMTGAGKDEWINRGVLCGASRSPARLAAALLAKPEWAAAQADSQSIFLDRLGRGIKTDAAPHALAEVLPGIGANAGESAGALAFVSGLAQSGAGSEVVRKAAGEPAITALIESARRLAADPNGRAEIRIRALELLAGVRAEKSDPIFLALLKGDAPLNVQESAAAGLARLGRLESCREVYQHWGGYTAAVRRAIVAASTESPTATTALLDAVEGGTVRPVEAPQTVRNALLRLPRRDLADRAARLLASAAPADRQAVIDKYSSAASMPGDQARGGALFKEHCAVCHAVQGVGQKIGPDLASVGSRTGNILLVDVLDPSRQVSSDFLGYIVATKDGKVVTGLVTAETSGSVTIRREGGAEETIPRDQIEEFQPTGKSLMPEGLEQKLTPQQIADVLEFLRRPNPDLLK